MQQGINKVILIGRLGNQPEIKYLNSGNNVVNLSIATSESWKDKVTGDLKESTEWHKVVMFGRLAEIANNYLTKGSKVYLEGKLQTRKWQDQTGVTKYSTEIIASNLQMLEPKQNSTQAISHFPPIANDEKHQDNGNTPGQLNNHPISNNTNNDNNGDWDDIPF